MVIRSVEKTMEFSEVVRAIEKLMGPVIWRAHLTGHSKKLGPLTVNTCKISYLQLYISLPISW